MTRTGGGRTVAGHRGATVAWVLACLVVGGVVTGCTGDEAADVPAPSRTADGSAATDMAAEDTERPSRGPLMDFLDTVRQGSVESPEAQLARLNRTEEIVSDCMAEQGFEYTPKDRGPELAAQREREASWETASTPDGDERIAAAAEYGYGITTMAAYDEAHPVSDEPPVDPNEERVAAMSDAEQRAWDLALWGEGQGIEYTEGSEAYDWTKYGCFGRAGHELGVDTRQGFDDSPWADLREEISDLESGVPADPRLAEARTGWADCMTEAGYPGYTDPREPMMEIMERDSQIWEQAGAGIELDLSTDDYLTSPEYLRQQAEVARLEAELAPVEIALAVADTTCQVEVDYEAHYSETWIAMQEEFYAAHRTDLDAWLAAYEEFQAAED